MSLQHLFECSLNNFASFPQIRADIFQNNEQRLLYLHALSLPSFVERTTIARMLSGSMRHDSGLHADEEFEGSSRSCISKEHVFELTAATFDEEAFMMDCEKVRTELDMADHFHTTGAPLHSRCVLCVVDSAHSHFYIIWQFHTQDRVAALYHTVRSCSTHIFNHHQRNDTSRVLIALRTCPGYFIGNPLRKSSNRHSHVRMPWLCRADPVGFLQQ